MELCDKMCVKIKALTKNVFYVLDPLFFHETQYLIRKKKFCIKFLPYTFFVRMIIYERRFID